AFAVAIEAIGFEDGADVLFVGEGGGARRLRGFGSPLGRREQDTANQPNEEDCPRGRAQLVGAAGGSGGRKHWANVNRSLCRGGKPTDCYRIGVRPVHIPHSAPRTPQLKVLPGWDANAQCGGGWEESRLWLGP